MSDDAFPHPLRCEAHGLAAAPDGRCVRCRRVEEQVASRRAIARFIVGVGLVIALLVGYEAAMALGRMRAERIASESSRPLPPAPSATDPSTTPREVTEVRAPRPKVTMAWPAEPAAPANSAASVGGRATEQASDIEAAAAEHDRALKSAMSHVDVVVYTTSWCPACKQARSWMNANGISYRERDVEQDRDAHEKLKKISGGTTIPTFDIEGQVHVGLSPSWVQGAMRSVAERRLSRDNF